MTISELISRLTDIQSNYGDIEVVYDDEEHDIQRIRGTEVSFQYVHDRPTNWTEYKQVVVLTEWEN